MPKINLQKTRWFKYFYELQKEFKLSAQQTAIYGYLYNHCQYKNDNGYCGYSDQRMADELDISYERFRKELAVLKNKKLIIIRNPGKRTKETGQSRMIYINTEVFIEDNQMSIADIEVENLRKENQRLKKQLEQLNKTLETLNKPVYGNTYTMLIYRVLSHKKIIDPSQKDELYAVLSPLYAALAVDHGHQEVENHILYVLGKMSDTKVRNPIGYLIKSAEEFMTHKQMQKLHSTVTDEEWEAHWSKPIDLRFIEKE